MTKVNGPAMSLDASGSIAGVMTFAKWKGRNYVRQLVRPSNPKTASQLGMRAMMRFLSQAWRDIGASPQASWDELAAQSNVSPFNAFVGFNQRRWRSFALPAQTYPIGTPTDGVAISSSDVTGGQRNVEITATLASTTGVWGIFIFRDTAEITVLNWNKVVWIAATPEDTSFLFTDGPLPAGTYHYRLALMMITNNAGTATADDTAVVT
jgi:hypothetical protein